jgi:hypothetical protein
MQLAKPDPIVHISPFFERTRILVRFLCVGFLAQAHAFGAATATATATGYEVSSSSPSIAWIDDNQLLFAGQKSGSDPKRRSFEPGKIYLWNDATKTARVYAEDAIYHSFCFSQGRVSYIISRNEAAQRVVYREGVLGTEKQIERPSRSESEFYSKFSCGMRKYEEFVPPLPKTHLNLVLREGDGYLTLRPHGPKEERTHPRNITLYPGKSEKPVTLSITWDESIGGWGTTYSEYRRAYVLPPQDLVPYTYKVNRGNWPPEEPRVVYLLETNGRVERISIPATDIFRIPRPTKAGWIYGGGPIKTPSASGLYLYDGKRATKVETGGINEIVVSANGCKAAVAINNRPLEMGTPVYLKIFNFCTEGN